MAMDKDVLGQALYDARNAFNNRSIDDLVNEYGSIEAVRLEAAKVDAECFINHLKTFANIPGLGLIAPNGAVTGSAKTE